MAPETSCCYTIPIPSERLGRSRGRLQAAEVEHVHGAALLRLCVVVLLSQELLYLGKHGERVSDENTLEHRDKYLKHA